jgi:hypothetical protein
MGRLENFAFALSGAVREIVFLVSGALMPFRA